jgi:hypothetical protein
MYTIIIYILILWMIKKYNRPGAQKLFSLAKSEGIQTTLKYIKEFISSRTEEQQLKESRHTKQSQGHIVSYNPFNRLQLDIFVLKNMRVIIKGMVIYYVSLIYLVVRCGPIQ